MPRERLLKYGCKNLNTLDLLSIIIGSVTKEKDVFQISNEVLSLVENTRDLKNITIENLVEIKGLNTIKALKIICSIELGRRLNEDIIINRKNLTILLR